MLKQVRVRAGRSRLGSGCIALHDGGWRQRSTGIGRAHISKRASHTLDRLVAATGPVKDKYGSKGKQKEREGNPVSAVALLEGVLTWCWQLSGAGKEVGSSI